jgi:hypothetical protein
VSSMHHMGGISRWIMVHGWFMASPGQNLKTLSEK